MFSPMFTGSLVVLFTIVNCIIYQMHKYANLIADQGEICIILYYSFLALVEAYIEGSQTIIHSAQ